MVVLPGLAAVSSALPAAQRKGSKRENNGARQTEIEVRCIQRVLRWLAEARNEPEVHPVSAKDLLKSLKAAQRYHRPRYDNAEAAKLEQAASQADPRVRLEIDMQDAQRAGQLLSCMRSGLTVAADAEGLQVELQVPGRGTKPGGSFLLTDQAAAALLTALETGHLRDLEKAFLTGGPDYPLFPGGLGILTPHAVIPVGDYRPLDPSVARKLLRAVEAAAGVRHVSGRGFHGFRRHRGGRPVEGQPDPHRHLPCSRAESCTDARRQAAQQRQGESGASGTGSPSGWGRTQPGDGLPRLRGRGPRPRTAPESAEPHRRGVDEALKCPS
jgi:hypothetical protein